MGELYNPFPKLPKNIRQIGERDEMVRLYLEDYVNTYLKRLYPKGGQDLRVGILLGNTEEHEGVPYLFVDGAMEMEDVTEDGEKVVFSELAWKKAYQSIEQLFPKRIILGWFLCGAPGCQLSPLNYWKQHGQYFAGKNQLMYLNSGLEGEEAIYITSEDGFYKLRGHSIYYERNQMMQDYMILRKDVRRVESGTGDTVIRDFRQRMDRNKSQVTARRSAISVLGGLCSVLSVAVLAGGVVMFNNYEKMKEMEGVIASVLPAKENGAAVYKAEKAEDVLIVEEAAGQVYPTTAPETMSPVLPETLPEQEKGQPEVPGDNQSEQSDQAAQPDQAAQSDQSLQSNQPSQAAQPSQEGTQSTHAAMSETAEVSASQKVYEVQDGETLYGICLRIYQNGSMKRLQEICELNGLEDADKIVSGQKLILPE